MNSEVRLNRLVRTMLAVSLTFGLVATLAQPGPVQVILREKTPLRLVRYDYGGGHGEVGLDGVLEVTLKNLGTTPVVARDLHVHGLLFVNAKTGERLLLVHSCECFFVTGDQAPPPSLVKRQTHRLAPGASESFSLEDFGCGGGMWEPPPPGEYLVYYRVLLPPEKEMPPPPSAPARPASAVIKECKERLLSETFWAGAPTSPPLRITLKKPLRKRVHA